MPTVEQLDPFDFSNWMNNDGTNECSTGDEAQVGNNNWIPSPDPNDPNSVTMVGATIFEVATPLNAALAARNDCLGDGVVGVSGESWGATRSIGVAGTCSTGCGVCGVASNSKVPAFPPSTGAFGVGDTFGVYGQSLPNENQALDSSAPQVGTGVYGVGDAVGVQGKSASANGSGCGVCGVGTNSVVQTPTSTGVYGV